MSVSERMHESGVRMGKIRSILGDVDSADLGFTMPHEHILTKPQGSGVKATGHVGADHALDDLERSVEMCTQ